MCLVSEKDNQTENNTSYVLFERYHSSLVRKNKVNKTAICNIEQNVQVCRYDKLDNVPFFKNSYLSWENLYYGVFSSYNTDVLEQLVLSGQRVLSEILLFFNKVNLDEAELYIYGLREKCSRATDVDIQYFIEESAFLPNSPLFIISLFSTKQASSLFDTEEIIEAYSRQGIKINRRFLCDTLNQTPAEIYNQKRKGKYNRIGKDLIEGFPIEFTISRGLDLGWLSRDK